MPEKILVVDDDVDSLKLIGLMLKRQGYEVSVANSGTPAIQKATQERPDLIILDVMMPDMDGYEVTRRLRAEESTAKIPIIMFTAKTLVDDKVKGFEAGVDDYLTKPTHPAELASRVKAVLARRQPGGAAEGEEVAEAQSGGYTVGFLGAKGGVGTTTLAASVAGLIAQQNRTVLTDIRPGQGTLGASLGVANSAGLANLLQRRANEITHQLVEQNLVAHDSGIRLLLSSINPQESRIVPTPEHLTTLRTALSQIATHTVFDLGAGLTQGTVRLIRDLSQIVVCMEPNHISLSIAQATLRELQNNVGISALRLSVVIINRSQTSLQLPWQDVEQALNLEVSAIISPAPELAYQAVEAQTPLALFQPQSIVAGQIAKLVEELMRRGG